MSALYSLYRELRDEGYTHDRAIAELASRIDLDTDTIARHLSKRRESGAAARRGRDPHRSKYGEAA